eukprot:1147865-Pelagomonas_calceolata.AAC.1
MDQSAGVHFLEFQGSELELDVFRLPQNLKPGLQKLVFQRLAWCWVSKKVVLAYERSSVAVKQCAYLTTRAFQSENVTLQEEA